jgi:hypothetical protein
MRLVGTILKMREVWMSHFVVRFVKDVLGGNGREIEVCQGTLNIDAADESEATELAKRRFCETQNLFCETQNLCNWSLHADRIRVRSVASPVRIARRQGVRHCANECAGVTDDIVSHRGAP